MQLVFVPSLVGRVPHVAAQTARNREALFRQVLFDNVRLSIRTPDWHAHLPGLDLQLASPTATASEAQQDSSILADLARDDPKAALDAVYAMLVDCADSDGRDLSDPEIRAFRDAANLVADERARPAIAPADTDEEILVNLGAVIDPEDPALAEMLRKAAAALTARAQESLSVNLATVFREQLNPMVARVVGALLGYFNDADARARIRDVVVAEINEAAAQAKAHHEPLVLMGHCLGGVILYDVLSAQDSCGLSGDVDVAALISVGSQIGLVNAAGLVDPPTPSNAARLRSWLDVVDPSDVLSVRAHVGLVVPETVLFDGITGLLPTHTAYFKRPQFHARVGKHLARLKLT